jgi:hypothetical protein
LAEHHTCDRCGEPIERWLLDAGQQRFVWIGRGYHPVELNLRCLNAVETLVYGGPRTHPPAAAAGAPHTVLARLCVCLRHLWRGRAGVC